MFYTNKKREVKLLVFFYSPVLPNPPSPLSVSSSVATSSHSTFSYFEIIN